jgi:hypothetical protein
MSIGARFGAPNRCFVAAVSAFAITLILVGAPARADHLDAEPTVTGLERAKPRESKLKPGLGVTYYLNRFNHIDELLLEAEVTKGHKGKPLPQLNYKVERGNVLTSDRANMIGAMIYGFIRLDRKGVYTFLLQSNDGVDLHIGGKRIYRDAEVHADDYSPPLTIEIGEPGWYTFDLAYFEKKNTATLELYWQRPGEKADPAFVPAGAFAHLPK